MLRRSLVLLPLVGLAWSALAAATAGAATLRTTSTVGPLDVSSNWAGYSVMGTEADGTPTSFTSVSARWVQPRARRCSERGTTYSAFWVGLGGATPTSPALEQIGTTADCKASHPAYRMWWEIVPAGAVRIKLKVAPGNVIGAVVSVSGTTVTLQIRNYTRGTRFTHVEQVATPDLSSAEWVAEAPSTCDFSGRCQTLRLTNFGHVAFTHVATTTATGHAGTLADPTWTPQGIELIEDDPLSLVFFTGGNPSGAVPGEPSADGSSFGVDWAKALTPPAVP